MNQKNPSASLLEIDVQGAVLLLYSLAGFGLTYATTILLAQTLGAEAYNDYAVAIASAAILATFAEMGTGKYAMRVLPRYYARKRWSLARGYISFSMALILGVSTLLGGVVAIAEGVEAHEFGSHAIGIVILFLPAMALLGFGIELAMANNAILSAAAIMRLLVPGVTLLAVVIWNVSPFQLTASRSAYCYACGTVVGLVLAWTLVSRTSPDEAHHARAEYQPKRWLFSALPFLYFGLLVSMLSKVGVILLEMIHPNESMVAVYSVAADTGSFLYVVAKATDKMFLPGMSLMIEQRDVTGMLRVRRHRRLLLGAVCVVYFSLISLFGKNILAMFGSQFVTGYPALCLFSAATCVWTLFSLAPAFLKFNQKNTLVVSLTALAVLANIVLCLLLGRQYGATGAAIAYAVPVSLLYIAFAYLSNQTLQQLREAPADMSDSLHDLDADEYMV